MTDLFKPEDFVGPIGASLSYRVMSAHTANAKFKEWVESCDVVYNNHHVAGWVGVEGASANKQARIFDIKEIEKDCEHTAYQNELSVWRCTECEERLKPKGGWVLDD